MQYHTPGVPSSAHRFSPSAQTFEQPLLSLPFNLSAAVDEAAKQWRPGWLSPGNSAASAPSVDLLALAAQTLIPVSNTGVKSSYADESVKFPVHIDWITFTVHGDYFHHNIYQAADFLERCTGIYTVGPCRGKGASGYKETWRVVERDGANSPDLGWVGASSNDDPMRGRWCFCLTGTACSYIKDWSALFEGLKEMGGRITRTDVALDDLEGEHPLAEMEALYDAGAFSGRGRPPKAHSINHKGGKAGDTFYVGDRKSGKLSRGYEKGKQLGDSESPWVRYESEFHHGNGRVIPLDILLMPGHFLKGAHPNAFSWMPTGIVQLHAMREKARITLAHAEKFAKRQVGRLICYMRECLGLGDADVVARLSACPGRYPLRLWSPALDGLIPWESGGFLSAEPAF